MVAPKMFSQPNNPNCTVKMFKTYLNHMPEDIKNQPTSRFYLRPLTNPASSVWYSHLPIGKNTIRKMMKSIASLGELELEGRKTNHSTRKTFATDLLDADIPNTELEVTQLGGWKSIQTLNEYAAPNIKKQKSVSDILSKAFLPKVTKENNSENRHLSINTDTSVTCQNFPLIYF
jgi:integrase